MRDMDHKILCRLVQAHGCIASVSAETGESEPMLKRRCSGSSDARPSIYFALEDSTGCYLLTRERMRDVLRTARDAGVDPEVVERAANDVKAIFGFLGMVETPDGDSGSDAR